MEEIKKDFEEWCEKNTAGFGSDDGDEFNISWDELQFYDSLVLKFNQSIDLAVSKERERVLEGLNKLQKYTGGSSVEPKDIRVKLVDITNLINTK